MQHASARIDPRRVLDFAHVLQPNNPGGGDPI